MKEDKPPSLADLNPSESPVVSGIGVEVISVFAVIIGFVIRFVIIWRDDFNRCTDDFYRHRGDFSRRLHHGGRYAHNSTTRQTHNQP